MNRRGGDSAGHLNDHEFGLVMMGEELEPQAQAHVDGCESCRVEMERFKGSVGEFGLAALRWSEAQRPAAPARVAGWRMYPAAAWALAAAVVLGVMVPVTVHFEHGQSAVESAANSGGAVSAGDAGGDSPEQIAKDNELLAAVDDELSQSQAQMLAAHGWRGGGRDESRERRR